MIYVKSPLKSSKISSRIVEIPIEITSSAMGGEEEETRDREREREKMKVMDVERRWYSR